MTYRDDMKITKLSDYMAFVEDMPRGFSLSRGQSSEYALLPSALRLDEHGNRKYPKRVIGQFLEQFKMNSYQYMDSPWAIKNEIEWMLYAQHFGIPTKLMDFTTSHLISLLFAVEKSFVDDRDHDATVYFLNPIELNGKTISQSQILSVSNDEALTSNTHDGPCAIQGRRMNSRVNAQKGVFVLFQDDDVALETNYGEEILRKVVINGSDKKQILSSLYSMGVSFTSIYPDLTSVAKDIIMQYDITELLREEV
jgi:hypothetical protein